MYNPQEISNFNQLCSYLRTSNDILTVLTDGHKLIFDAKKFEVIGDHTKNPKTVFQRFYIPKRNKKLGYRVVYKPRDQSTIDILKVLKFNLDGIYQPLNCVQGFVRNRNTKSNASLHLGKKYLLKLDILDFFESIDQSLVLDGLKSMGFIDEIAFEISKITTLQGKLIQGFPTSPVIANITCLKLDLELSTFCEEHNLVYSRYADDINISSDFEHPPLQKIKTIIEKYKFKINEFKTQKFKAGQNLFVTGLSIADKKYPRIPKAIKKRIRKELHYLDLYGYHSHICHINDWDESTDLSVTGQISHSLSNQIKGMIDYINAIETIVAKKFYKKYNDIEKKEMALRIMRHEAEIKKWRHFYTDIRHKNAEP